MAGEDLKPMPDDKSMAGEDLKPMPDEDDKSMSGEEIYQAIPHRPPFLFVDTISEISPERIKTTKRVQPEEPFFQGHYPGNPIMPGVLLCESMFQSGAILISRRIAFKGQGIPVLTRIQEARFRRMVKPGDLLEIEVEVLEIIKDVYFLKGKVAVLGKIAATVKFACTLVNNS